MSGAGLCFWSSKKENSKLKCFLILGSFFIAKYQFRSHIRKSLVKIQKENIPEAENCNPEETYDPDFELDKLLADKIGCLLPWSHFKINGIRTCQQETDFEKYFESYHSIQEDIQKIPKKCNVPRWILTHYDGDTVDGNNELVLDLISMSNEVNLNFYN